MASPKETAARLYANRMLDDFEKSFREIDDPRILGALQLEVLKLRDTEPFKGIHDVWTRANNLQNAIAKKIKQIQEKRKLVVKAQNALKKKPKSEGISNTIQNRIRQNLLKRLANNPVIRGRATYKGLASRGVVSSYSYSAVGKEETKLSNVLNIPITHNKTNNSYNSYNNSSYSYHSNNIGSYSSYSNGNYSSYNRYNSYFRGVL